MTRALDQLLAGGDGGRSERGRLSAARDRLRAGEMTVAVIGRQGVGKSSLLDALLGRRVLPIDETETTNVVCKLRAAAAEPEVAEVHYLDGRVLCGEPSDTFLREWTDEQQNAGNRKGVKEVVVRLRTPLLDPGIVLADTPGVDSLKDSVIAATMEFLPNISTAIFLMSTTPTLLESERRFLRATWATAAAFIFVQNTWAGTEDEIDEARKDNLRKLREVAKSEGSSVEVELLTVDVHAAVDGAVNGWTDQVRRSGLESLVDALRARLDAGPRPRLVRDEGGVIANAIEVARRAARARSDALRNPGAADAPAFVARLAEGRARLDALAHEWTSVKDRFRTDVGAALDGFHEQLGDRLSRVEVDLVATAEARKLDAARLRRALEDRATLANSDTTREAVRTYAEAARTFVLRADALVRGQHAQTVIIGTAMDVGGAELLERAGGVVGSLGNMALGLLGIASMVGAEIPGWGWLAAAGAWALGRGINYLTGRHVTEKLADAIRQTCASARERAVEHVRHAIERHAAKVEAEVDDAFHAACDQEQALLAQILADRDRDRNDAETLRAALVAMVGTLEIAGAEVRAAMADLETP